MLNHVTMFQPSAIDNSFSTLQIIHKLIKHMNKVIDEVNSIDSKANKYTDEKIAEVRQEITELNNTLQSQLTTLERQLKTYSDNNLNTAEEYTDVAVEQFKLNYVIPQLTQIRETITLIENRLDAKIDLVDVTLKNLIQETKAELLELIKKGGAVYSGVTGELTNADNAIKQLVNKVQNKNGVSWYKINKLYRNSIDYANLEQVYVWQAHNEPKIIVYMSPSLKNALSGSPYMSSTTINGVNYLTWNDYVPTPSMFIIGFGSTNISSLNINGIPIVPDGFNSSDKVSSSLNVRYFNTNTISGNPIGSCFKLINTVQMCFTDGHIITGVIVIQKEGTSEPTQLPFTWDMLQTNLANNDKWNTWDCLTYYTIKFLNTNSKVSGEGLETPYDIYFDNENEKLSNDTENIFYNNSN